MDDFIDDLDTSTGPRLMGNVPRQLFIEHARDLTEADIAALATNRGTKPKSLVRIHASHHSLAKCLATGMKQSQAALVERLERRLGSERAHVDLCGEFMRPVRRRRMIRAPRQQCRHESQQDDLGPTWKLGPP